MKPIERLLNTSHLIDGFLAFSAVPGAGYSSWLVCEAAITRSARERNLHKKEINYFLFYFAPSSLGLLCESEMERKWSCEAVEVGIGHCDFSSGASISLKIQ